MNIVVTWKNDEAETAVVETLRKNLSGDGAHKFADVMMFRQKQHKIVLETAI